MTGWVPFAVLLFGTSRQRLEAALAYALDVVGGGVVGGVVPPPLTRYTTVPCAGTLALIVPLLELVALVHASTRVNDEPDLPMAAAVVEIVVVEPPWLNRATATSPLARRLASTRRVPSNDTCVPCNP